MVVPTAPRDPSWAVCAPNDVEEAGVAFGHHDPVFMTVEMLAQLPRRERDSRTSARRRG